jgi:hypothetical protein
LEDSGMAEDNPVLQFTESHCAILGKNIEDITADALKSLFGHVYFIWRTFKPALGEELGVKLYGNVWAELARMSFAGALQKLELDQVTDLPTFGRIVRECFIGVPALYVIKRNEPEEHVGHILWCANPAYGPADEIYARHEYYRKEVYLTYVYLWALIEEAKKKGLEQDITVDMPSGRCRDGVCAACQVVLRTRDADPAVHLPEVENRFIEDEMGDQEPVSFILREQGRSFEEQGPATFSGFFAVDFLAWLQLFTNDKGTATDIYCRLWENYRRDWLNEAKLELEIGRVTTAKELADIIAYCQKKKYIAFSSAEGANAMVKLTSTADPFVQIADMFDAPSAYKEALVEMDQNFMDGLIRDLKLEDRAEDSIVTHIARGDTRTEINVVLH